jgi:hypothetical protein
LTFGFGRHEKINIKNKKNEMLLSQFCDILLNQAVHEILSSLINVRRKKSESIMPSLDDVYQKFGLASEAAQLLETELGTVLFVSGAIDQNLIENQNPDAATALYNSINRKTLGQLLKGVKNTSESVEHLEELLSNALKERNRLSHSFYRQHNFRRNTEDGRLLMLDDLEKIHEVLLEAYKAVMRLSGIDLDKIELQGLPTDHVPI